MTLMSPNRNVAVGGSSAVLTSDIGAYPAGTVLSSTPVEAINDISNGDVCTIDTRLCDGAASFGT